VQSLTDSRHVQEDEILSQAAAAIQLITRGQIGQQAFNEFETVEGRIARLQAVGASHDAILKWLSFSAMQDRLESIQRTHPGTFEWIFDSQFQADGYFNLPAWLSGRGSGIYWVKGREGSGKSTLMKYIWQSKRTKDYLQAWRGSSELYTATFCLWRAGSSLAKSPRGLLRSLLYTLLSQKPDLASQVFPYQFSVFYRALREDIDISGEVDPPSLPELDAAFKRFVDVPSKPKIFLLIDGLDECEESVDQLVNLCRQLGRSTNVKMIISSRATVDSIFSTAFSASPNLVLQNLNKPDIEKFVRGSFSQDSAFRQRFQDKQDEATSLAAAITERSQGLFLWASIAVPSILEGVNNSDSIDDLLQKLAELPQEITQLYDDQLKKIPATHREDTLRLLQLLLEWNRVQTRYTYNSENFRAMPLLDLYFAEGDMEQLLSSQNEAMNDEEKAWRSHNIGIRLEKRCADFVLIENRPARHGIYGPQSRVQFCHRTVLDYFMGEEQIQYLQDATGKSSFDLALSLMKSVVHRLKTVDTELSLSRKTIWDLAVAALVYANHVESVAGENSTLNEYVDLLTEMDRTMQSHHQSLLRCKDDWMSKTYLLGTTTRTDNGWLAKKYASFHWSNFHPSIKQPLNWQNNMHSMTVQFDLHRYLKLCFENEGRLLRKKGRPLLSYALCPLEDINYKLVSVATVELLLNKGARLTEKFASTTCWEHAMSWQYRRVVDLKQKALTFEDQETNSVRLQIFSLLVTKYKADIDAIFCAQGEEVAQVQNISVQEFFKTCFGDSDELTRILAEARSKSSWWKDRLKQARANA
jgi:hypothetical protein